MTDFRIGQRVKVIDQDITGTIVRHDTGNKWVVLDDDRDDWAEEGEEGVLVFRTSELEVVLATPEEIVRENRNDDMAAWLGVKRD